MMSKLLTNSCTFEENPADYSVLKLVKVPSTGGDTLWASGCEICKSFAY